MLLCLSDVEHQINQNNALIVVPHTSKMVHDGNTANPTLTQNGTTFVYAKITKPLSTAQGKETLMMIQCTTVYAITKNNTRNLYENYTFLAEQMDLENSILPSH